MVKDPAWLLGYAKSVSSQGGEDGILQKVLELLPERDRWCVEFGAWDGIHCSNTRRLIAEEDYGGVLIEADPVRFGDLEATYQGRDRMHLLNKMVGYREADGLDALLKDTPLPKDYDLLSIDIDGSDYHVWKACQKYQPKVVIIEYNPTIPTEVEFVQSEEPGASRAGCSLLSLFKLGKEKGYELVAATTLNAIFVRSEYFPRYDIADNAPERLRRDCSHVTRLFFGYDGTVHLAGNQEMPWHGYHVREADFQALPRSLRTFPGDFTPRQKWWFRKFRKLPRWLRRFLSS